MVGHKRVIWRMSKTFLRRFASLVTAPKRVLISCGLFKVPLGMTGFDGLLKDICLGTKRRCDVLNLPLSSFTFSVSQNLSSRIIHRK